MSILDMLITVLSMIESDSEEMVFAVDRSKMSAHFNYHLLDFMILKARKVTTRHLGGLRSVLTFEDVSYRFL